MASDKDLLPEWDEKKQLLYELCYNHIKLKPESETRVQPMISVQSSPMAQWAHRFINDATNIPASPVIPKEWEKANKALLEVQQPKQSTASAATTTATTASTNEQALYSNYSYPYWPSQQMYHYTGYPGYQIHNYGYNLNMDPSFGSGVYNNAATNSYYVPPASVIPNPAPNVPPQPPEPAVQIKSESGSENSKSSSTDSAVSSVLPVPPPPSSTPPEVKKEEKIGHYSTPCNIQTPGAGGIRFSLPKRGIPHAGSPSVNYPGRGKKHGRINASYPMNNQSSQKFGAFSSSSEETSESPQSPAAKQRNQVVMNEAAWPDSLRSYVKRCFDKCKTPLDKDQVEIILKGKLTKAYTDGSIWTNDWDTEALPSIHSERVAKEQMKQSSHSSSPSPASSTKSSLYTRSRNSHSSYQRHKSRSRSRSRSRSPFPRKVIRQRRHSSSSTSSSDSSDSYYSKKQVLSSSIVGPVESPAKEWANGNQSGTKKNKRKYKAPPFTVDEDLGSEERLQKRKARFQTSDTDKRSQVLGLDIKKKFEPFVFTTKNTTVIDEDPDIDWSFYTIVGTSEDLEKPYLRLTSAPDPSTVRPEDVLVKALAMVKARYGEKQDYHYACDQLKSIRQDLTVQCIRNEFTVQVYETHARIALEKGDHEEFNQCQTQLKSLYVEIQCGNKTEFTGYRILYYIFCKNTLEIKNLLANLSPEEKESEVISHALKVLSAWSLSNYHKFFKLYLESPKMSACIIDWFADRERKKALKAILKSFRPTLPVSLVQNKLAFSSMDSCLAFLGQNGVVFEGHDQSVINCRESANAIMAS